MLSRVIALTIMAVEYRPITSGSQTDRSAPLLEVINPE